MNKILVITALGLLLAAHGAPLPAAGHGSLNRWRLLSDRLTPLLPVSMARATDALINVGLVILGWRIGL